MKHKQDPQMAEAFQATHGVGLVVGRDQMEFSAAVFHQTGWRGTANFSLYGERITPICAN
jgi:hypothetical protein